MRIRWLIVLLLTASGASAKIQSVNRIGITVGDLDRSIQFYVRVLDFELISREESAGPELERQTGVFGARIERAVLRLGSEEIALTEYLASPGQAHPPDSRSNDRWFQHIAIVVSDIDAAYRRLRAFDVKHASTGPQTLPDWNPNAAGIRAFYFRDPDGHALEIIWFPSGKGDPRWPSQKGLFLGIDHTAIVVADTDKSLSFYRDAFGLRVAGESENHGPEQERLNNVPGARLRITTLKPAHGPAIEFLEYQAPRDGRAYPENAKPNDLLHWQVEVVSDDPDADAARALANAGKSISSRLIRDPDGHAILLSK